MSVTCSAKAVPQAHEEGLEYGDNAADIAADNMAATFAAKAAHEEMQRNESVIISQVVILFNHCN